jgi:hypothetical protein
VVLRIVAAVGIFCLMTTAAAAAALGSGAPDSQTPDVQIIVERMLQAQRQNTARVRAFTVKRGYLLRDKQEQEKAHIVARITHVPPDDRQYQVESGSGGFGEKVLRDVLSKDAERPSATQRAELSPSNYDFQFLGEAELEGRRCYLLRLNPRREEKDLLRGQVWIDAKTYNVRRIEGSPVKAPSWWIRDLHVFMSFAEIDGMWLRTFTHAVANVRFKGRYVMESRDLEYRFDVQTASRPRRNPAILAGSAVDP